MKNLILALLITSANSVAFASTVYITFTNLPATQGNGTTKSQSNTYDGEAATTVAGFGTQELVCDNFANTTYVPSPPIDFSVNTLSTLTASDVDFSSGFVTGLVGEGISMSQIQAYDTAAVLLTNLEIFATTGQQIADYQYAIWDLMAPGADSDGMMDSPLDANAANYLQSAFSAATAATPTAATIKAENLLVIYTPTAAFSSNQEFLWLDPPAPAPEPSTWLLMAALGLFLSVPQVRSRLRAALSRN